MNKYLNVKFGVIWDNITCYLYPEEIDALKNGIKFEYSERTTIKQLFLKLNEEFENINNQHRELNCKNINKDKTLEYLYRIAFNNEPMYIFDLEITVAELVRYVNSNNIKIILTLFRGIGGEIYRYDGIHFYMHSKEGYKHHEPHVHAKYGEYEISIGLLSDTIQGKMPKQIIKKIKQVIRVNRNSFLLKWNAMVDGQKYVFEDYQIDREF